MKRQAIARAFAGVLATISASVLAGCGGSEGLKSGANSPTTVTVKHDASKGDGQSVKPSGGNAAAPAATGAAPAGGVGTFRGKVVFKGDPPKIAPLFEKGAVMKEPICVKEAAIPNEKLVLGTGNAVANVFVFMAKAPTGVTVPPPSDQPVVFDQKNCRFLPHTLLCRAGQTVKVLNSDSVAHNTHTLPQRNDQFNQPIAPNNKTGIDFTYKRPEMSPVYVKCDIHAWMSAQHLPLDHPWAAISGPNGEFEIKDIPAGTHKFQVWHEAAVGKYIDRNLMVTVKPGEVTTQDIEYDASKFEN